ncbi:hypothetical protein LZB49_08195, partial [Campylobacter lari]
GSDILVLRLMSPEGAVVTGISVAAGATTLTVSSDGMARLKANAAGTPTVFGVADCTRADVFPATISGSTL